MLNQHKTVRESIAKYNKPNPLAEYLIPFLGNKKEVKILDIGSGPYSIIGNYLHGTKIDLRLCDNQNFIPFWEKYKAKPLLPVEYQDMENMTFQDNTFDLVHCANALDHTRHAYSAVEELIRVCKVGGWVYIDCHLDQKETRHKHYWNAKKDGTFEDNISSFNLKDVFGFNIKYIDNGGESRYNKIIATLQKT